MGDTYTGADLLVDCLVEYGVRYVFGNPGTTELPVIRAIERSDVDYILALHEDIAIGIASGYACARRYQSHHDPSIVPVGVANLHLAAGVAHGLGNLYNANIMGIPLVVTAGNHGRAALHEEPILGGDLIKLTEQFTKWSTEVRDVDALPVMLRRAFRLALTPPTGPVFLSLPIDVMLEETTATPQRLGAIQNAGRGDPSQIDRAVDLIVGADEPLLVLGDGVARSGAVQAAVNFAEASGARVCGEILASEVNFPADHDQWNVHLPMVNESLTRELFNTDTLICIGCSTNAMLLRRYGDLVSPETTCIHVTDDPFQVGKNQPADVVLIGDPGLIMSELATQIRGQLSDVAREQRLERAAEIKSETLEATKSLVADRTDDQGVSKAELVDTVREITNDAFLVEEALTVKPILVSRWALPVEQYVSNKGLGLGFGLPMAIGVSLAQQESESIKPVIGLIGDGSYLYYPQALYTATRYGIDLVVVVPDNRNYRILKNNYIDLFGAEIPDEFKPFNFEPPVSIPTSAESYGASSRLVEDIDDFADALRSGLETAGPVVIDVLTHD